MKILKIIIGVQFVVIIYLIRASGELTNQIAESATAVAGSTKKIESMADDNYNLHQMLNGCKYELDKYRQETINPPQ